MTFSSSRNICVNQGHFYDLSLFYPFDFAMFIQFIVTYSIKYEI